VEAVVLTHAHFDHLGFAERARATFNVPVYVHQNDVPLTRHPWRYDHERARAYYFATQVRALPMVAAFVRNRAWWPAPVKEVVRYESGTLPVPGSPQVIFTPGHTHGHCALHLPDRNVVIAGDAVVTLDPYPRARGPASSRGRLRSILPVTSRRLTRSRVRGPRLCLSAMVTRGPRGPKRRSS